jgi:ubiquitin
MRAHQAYATPTKISNEESQLKDDVLATAVEEII